MNSVSGNAKGLSAHVVQPAVRSRPVFIVLLLSLGGVTSTLPAQPSLAAQVLADTSYSLDISGDSGLQRICAGDSVAFSVIATRRTVTKFEAGVPT